MGKNKLGRVRKYSHRKYHPHPATPNPDQQPCRLQNQFQFSLRNVSPAVLHQSSIYNYSRVFTILSNDGVFKNQWNLIKHTELYQSPGLQESLWFSFDALTFAAFFSPCFHLHQCTYLHVFLTSPQCDTPFCT